MKRRSPQLGLDELTMILCAVGIAVSLIPLAVYSKSFWGLRNFADKELFSTDRSPGVLVLELEPGTPATRAGIEKGDRIVSVNGTFAEFHTFRRLLASIRPGAPVNLEVVRGGHSLSLTGVGFNPELEAVVFLDWQLVSAPVFLLLLVLSIATQPLQPPPLWRSILVILGGLSVVMVTAFVELRSFLPYTIIWQSKPLDNPPIPAQHYSLTAGTMAAGLVVSLLGAFAVRAVLIHRRDLRVE